MAIHSTTTDVAADMARVFAPLMQDGAAGASADPAGAAAAPAVAASKRPFFRVAVLASGLILGLALANSGVSFDRLVHVMTPSPVTAPPSPPAPKTSSALRARDDAQSSASGSSYAFVEADDRPDRARATERVAHVQVPPAPSLAILSAANRSLGEAAKPARATIATRGAQASGGAPAADPTASGTRCHAGSQDNDCIFQDVMRADAELRLAYDRATQDGVSGSWLNDLNWRWSQARENAEYDPDGTIRRYHQLADALDRKRLEIDR